MSATGRAVVQPLVDGVHRRDVLAHEELRRRLPVAEHVIGRAEPGLQILVVQRAFLGGEYHGCRQEDVRSHLLLVKGITEALETEAGLQREPVQRPTILRIQGEYALMLMLV